MTSLQISYFLKTAEYMSFSRAAQALYVTQPSVSRQIKLLEAELGDNEQIEYLDKYYNKRGIEMLDWTEVHKVVQPKRSEP